jgi:hypothetical protein
MRPIAGEPAPDMVEVDRAGYFSLEEIQALEQVPPINLEVAKRALADDQRLLAPEKVLGPAGALYTLFIG